MARNHADGHGGKVFSSVMMARAFTLLDKHGTRFQFGGRIPIWHKGGHATRNGFNLPPLCAIWIGNAHWTRHVGVEDQMRLFSPSTILPTPVADKHCGHHNSTCISPQTPRTLRTHSTGRTPPRLTSILSNDCHTRPTVPHELPHWMPGCCCCHTVPKKTRQYQWHCDTTHGKVC